MSLHVTGQTTGLLLISADLANISPSSNYFPIIRSIPIKRRLFTTSKHIYLYTVIIAITHTLVCKLYNIFFSNQNMNVLLRPTGQQQWPIYLWRTGTLRERAKSSRRRAVREKELDIGRRAAFDWVVGRAAGSFITLIPFHSSSWTLSKRGAATETGRVEWRCHAL